ncbi:hypothetical protein ASPZODRAFT_13018 [Penicilliopsis zonata CBS 506.65]|uniref:Uncharacterized protein n=1 Tax=Penicilliopsis zonata CBS 506.65 TaxID=1073090 RepID=A0A1L9SRV6_9EURO|nr:hypothetical protein ASPZODRAFT_13018 [Penicilliopsis zonata CBS 506.65]OJJ49908.1 hypothetical protein ASPZODRAFT_13018 [Penicilliopsis zonata CBS 506.65]
MAPAATGNVTKDYVPKNPLSGISTSTAYLTNVHDDLGTAPSQHRETSILIRPENPYCSLGPLPTALSIFHCPPTHSASLLRREREIRIRILADHSFFNDPQVFFSAPFTSFRLLRETHLLSHPLPLHRPAYPIYLLRLRPPSLALRPSFPSTPSPTALSLTAGSHLQPPPPPPPPLRPSSPPSPPSSSSLL